MPVQQKTRVARFKVQVNLDGKAESTLEIEMGRVPMATVRPKGARHSYSVPLSVVVSMIAYRAAKDKLTKEI